MNPDELALFLDTNTLLHYPPLKDVDWRAIGGCANVRLILCMQVIHELDGKKDDPRLGERASRAIKDTKAFRKAAGVVRDGVTLEVFNYEVRAADFPDTLSFDSKDDRIVRSVKKYQGDHPGLRVEVYTEDMGMSLRCEANNVAVIEPDTKKRLENPQDEFAKKSKQMKDELNELKTRVPVVEVIACATGLTTPEKRQLEFTITGAVEVRDLDAELAAYQQENNLSMMLKSEIGRFGASPVLPQQHDAVEQYNRKLDDHLKECEQWLTHSANIDLYEAHRIEFSLWLINTGAAPADDIHVTVEVGNSVVFLHETGSKDAAIFTRPTLPEPPVRPTQFFGGFGEYIRVPLEPRFLPLGREHFAHLRDKSTEVVKADGERPHRIKFKANRLKHNESEHVGDFVAVVRPDAIRPFTMKYRITAANLLKPVEGVIPVIVRKQKVGA